MPEPYMRRNSLPVPRGWPEGHTFVLPGHTDRLTEGYEVSGLKAQDRRGDIIIVQRNRRWRAYWDCVHESAYGGGWGRIDHAVHIHFRAVRSADTGRPFTARGAPYDLFNDLMAADRADAILPNPEG